VRISVDPGPGRSPVPGVVEIEFAGGARMRIAGTVDAATLKAAIAALSGGERR
jgi:transposase